ncbi:MAG: glycosyltransferase, partial [Pseudomonadota bacterium]
AEDVRDGETGLIVPPRDPGALAAAMDRVIDDPALAERLGQAGHDHSEAHFSWTAVAGTMGRVLAEDVNAKRTGALTTTDAKRPARA